LWASKAERDGTIAVVRPRLTLAAALGIALASPALADEPRKALDPCAPDAAKSGGANAGDAAKSGGANAGDAAKSGAAGSGANGATGPGAGGATGAGAGDAGANGVKRAEDGAAAIAIPADGPTAVAQARSAVEDQRYDDALALLAPQLSSPSRRMRAAALEITAVVRLLVGRTAEGREAVAALYEMAPAFQLDDPSLPPRVTRVFEAEAAVPHAHAVTLAIRPAPAAIERGSFEISASRPAGGVDLACRPASQKAASFAPIAVTAAGGGFRFKLPTIAPYGCYAIARDADGLPLGRLGSAAHPVDVTPPPAPPPAAPLYTRWWVWTGAGAVAAAVALGVIFGTQTRPAPPAADITIKPQQAVFSW
jgi:hypothetical protein